MAPIDQLTSGEAAVLTQSVLRLDQPPPLSPIDEGGEHHS
ncbi:hypothetical protein SAMN05421505_15015 [Sinosporangium album]|uniref:Uncharacterized protein n=1 Tax=Sinosporangium album TaxID=504805 RepID=A0A1G8KF43_9ACTN|nr:hypothetical protein SAMN05421505_15015 [Sinosporangium album]